MRTDGELLYLKTTKFQTILDTGSEQSSIRLAATWRWYAAIDGAIYVGGGHRYDSSCSANTSLPDLILLYVKVPAHFRAFRTRWRVSMFDSVRIIIRTYKLLKLFLSQSRAGFFIAKLTRLNLQ